MWFIRKKQTIWRLWGCNLIFFCKIFLSDYLTSQILAGLYTKEQQNQNVQFQSFVVILWSIESYLRLPIKFLLVFFPLSLVDEVNTFDCIRHDLLLVFFVVLCFNKPNWSELGSTTQCQLSSNVFSCTYVCFIRLNLSVNLNFFR